MLNAAAASLAARVEVAGCLLRSKKLVSSPRTVSLLPRHLPSSTTPLGTEPGGQQSRRRVLSNGGRQHLAAGWNLICFLFGFSKRYIYIRFWGFSRTKREPSAVCLTFSATRSLFPLPTFGLHRKQALRPSVPLRGEVATAASPASQRQPEEGGAAWGWEQRAGQGRLR